MIASRDINLLQLGVSIRAQGLVEKCKKEGIDLLITSTYRDFEAQKDLYAVGRTKAGQKCNCAKTFTGKCLKHPLGLTVTNANAGQSWHNWKRAFDVVPLVNGKCVWNDMELWKKIGAFGKALELEWAGDWKTFKEFPHFQYTQGFTLQDMLKKYPKGLVNE